jgi:hypothetical protein
MKGVLAIALDRTLQGVAAEEFRRVLRAVRMILARLFFAPLGRSPHPVSHVERKS